jgi:hypothetical protein
MRLHIGPPLFHREFKACGLGAARSCAVGATTEEGAYDDLARTRSIGSPSGANTGFACLQRSLTSFRTPISQSTETLVFSMPGWAWGRDYPFEAD